MNKSYKPKKYVLIAYGRNMKRQKLCPVNHLLQLFKDPIAVSMLEALMQNSLHLSDSQAGNCCNKLL